MFYSILCFLCWKWFFLSYKKDKKKFFYSHKSEMHKFFVGFRIHATFWISKCLVFIFCWIIFFSLFHFMWVFLRPELMIVSEFLCRDTKQCRFSSLTMFFFFRRSEHKWQRALDNNSFSCGFRACSAFLYPLCTIAVCCGCVWFTIHALFIRLFLR